MACPMTGGHGNVERFLLYQSSLSQSVPVVITPPMVGQAVEAVPNVNDVTCQLRRKRLGLRIQPWVGVGVFQLYDTADVAPVLLQ